MESNFKILLLEAGNFDNTNTKNDSNIGSMFTSWGINYDWKHKSVNIKTLNGREVDISKSKVYDGGTSINAIMYVRGSSKDFNRWESYGNKV